MQMSVSGINITVVNYNLENLLKIPDIDAVPSIGG